MDCPLPDSDNATDVSVHHVLIAVHVGDFTSLWCSGVSWGIREDFGNGESNCIPVPSNGILKKKDMETAGF